MYLDRQRGFNLLSVKQLNHLSGARLVKLASPALEHVSWTYRGEILAYA